MTSSPPSGSEPTNAFDLLHPEIRRWIWEQRWQELRDVQDRTIRAVLGGTDDILVMAATAAGKTEAAFLPALTAVSERKEKGISILYVSPLKALINDQFRRLEQLCERLEIGVVRWHGDAPQAAKERFRRDPRGIALITPESIEALFVRRPGDARKLLGSIDFIIVDEVHSFLTGPRGLHLASLLGRIDALSARRPRRIGLSATIGAPDTAASWLNPSAPESVELIHSSSGSPELRLQVRGYIDLPDIDDVDAIETDEGPRTSLDHIADHLFAVLRGSNNLVFAGSRRRVEALADRLRRRCEAATAPNEFFPHHGSLSRILREDLEVRLKDGGLPTTAVATTTLELGIDIGSVTSVAQVGAPRSMASLRQRLGRSGRREGMPAVLRIYVRERHLPPDADPLDRLRVETVMSVAAVRLLTERFVEPPSDDPSIATVVLHQTLSVIAERGGVKPAALYSLICGRGPLSALAPADFAELLRSMGPSGSNLIEQAPDGTIMLGEVGEGVTSRRDFYAIFPTDEEWTLVADGRTLGTLPISNVVGIGSLVAFAGQRWRVRALDEVHGVLEVELHRSGKVPMFDGSGREALHDRLLSEMLSVYAAADAPSYLDARARELLVEGRAAFADLGLPSIRMIEAGRDVHVLLWRGTQACEVFGTCLRSCGLEVEINDLGVTVGRAPLDDVRSAVSDLASRATVSPDEIVDFVGNLRAAKYDQFVPDGVLRTLWARRHVAAAAAVPRMAQEVLAAERHPGFEDP